MFNTNIYHRFPHTVVLGQKLEETYGDDVSNGWAYNHALGKLRQYQVHLLRKLRPDSHNMDDDELFEHISVAEQEAME